MIVLPMFVCLEGQFVDSVEDLLLGCGPCHVACFHHCDAVSTVTLDKTREEVVAEQLLMVNLSYLIMVG